MDKMRKTIVFFIQNFSRPGGSERVTAIIANELVKKGYDISILSICGDNTSFFDLSPEIKLVTLFNKAEVNNKKEFFSVLRELKKFYSGNHVDIVIDVFAALSIYTILIKKQLGLKNISWEHFNYNVNTGMNRLGRKLAVRYSDQIITLTNTDKQNYEKNNKIRCKIDYIYNPSPFQNPIVDQVKQKWLISVGRLSYEKGYDRLIKAWSHSENYCDWELLILGDGKERNELQKLIDQLQLKRVKLIGAVKDVEKYYRQASIYISTSRYEGLPMTMIEAQSFGIPIISFDYENGPKEIIENDKTGIIISKGDEGEMIANCSKEIISLINDPIRINRYSNNAKISANRFEMTPIIEKWNKIILEL